MPTLLDNMMSEVYRKPHIINFVQLMLRARSDVDWEASSNLYTIGLPKRFANKEFDECFAHFICRGCLCLAVLRSGETLRSEQPYVYTNPRPDTRLAKRDKLMVICTAKEHRAILVEQEREAISNSNGSFNDKAREKNSGMMSPIASNRDHKALASGSSSSDSSTPEKKNPKESMDRAANSVNRELEKGKVMSPVSEA